MQSKMAYLASGATTWQAGLNICIVFYSSLFGPLCENLTSSTKSEVCNVLHCHQEDQATATVTCIKSVFFSTATVKHAVYNSFANNGIFQLLCIILAC